MKWRQDIRSKRRVRISAISNQAHSHIEKVTSLMWVSPNALVSHLNPRLAALKSLSNYYIKLMYEVQSDICLEIADLDLYNFNLLSVLW